MDINELKSLAESRFDHAVYRKQLYEKFQTQLFVTYAGGQFKATKELITFLNYWPDDELVLEDIHQNPIRVNRTELLVELEQAYRFIMNAWHQEFEQSKKIRKGKDVI